ncbi:BnaC04g24120D [Brassica napus]|uniref:Helicase ATP-binding domain-containing protein n=2 Tax=Brassica TaxID=3705 RepID=A0A3P6CGC0_BRAOL|nr:unnamed protein product [Brassica napus]CDY31012.1 BnaC04g24120D [Brassica napus]VDD09595.1 unnamed protein product [Brassica oleracea]
MKVLIFKLLRQETDHEVSKDTLYVLCHICLVSLVFCLSEATTQIKGSGKNRGALIVREADNMLWMVDKLIRKKYNKEISKDHKVLSKLRHECERAKRALNNQHQNYRKYEELGEVEYLVLDEADQMLAVGFEEAVESILENLPQKRHSMLFSAT